MFIVYWLFAVQVANQGYDAFSIAHKNMDLIKLKTKRVPEYMKDALETIREVLLKLNLPWRISHT